ncbi:thymidine kinase [Flavimobilis soli]|uniref:thymidine kinase n=1 Tax=Flavimobilis soli TaxID=442709 RepID=UPI000BF78409|nr:thymidine kinase [Flavimobilis soli]
MTDDVRAGPPSRPGRVEVITGPMFAGKSEELLRRVRRAGFAGLSVEVVHHAVDTRRGAGAVSSHSGLEVPAVPVADVAGLEAHVAATRPGGLDLLAIDEAQFFGPDLVDAVQRFAGLGLVVVVAGLDVTFEARPFEPMPSLAALAESVTRLTAVCSVCGADAAFHERVVAGDRVAEVREARPELVGGAESYVARCRHHLAARPWDRG